jgi:MFS family permease
LVYVMVAAQGLLGYGVTSVMGAVVLEIFQGKHYGSIFGTIMLASLAGGAAGPFVTGVLHGITGTYTVAFILGIGVSFVAATTIWLASPGKVRAVAGRLYLAQSAVPDPQQGTVS